MAPATYPQPTPKLLRDELPTAPDVVVKIYFAGNSTLNKYVFIYVTIIQHLLTKKSGLNTVHSLQVSVFTNLLVIHKVYPLQEPHQ